MDDLQLQVTMDTIGTALRDSGKNPDEIEELLHAEAVRVAEELKEQEES